MKLKDHEPIKIYPNRSTIKYVMELPPNYKVYFREPNSINSLLGFESNIYDAAYNESENHVDILKVNSIMVKLNIINGSYIRGKKEPIVYSFFPEVGPGFKLVETPRNLVYLPINCSEISELKVTLTDQNGKLLNLREEVTIRFHMREL